MQIENNLIKNKNIEFLVYDDKYEPELTLENTNKLIYQDKIFALFGYVGTPTVKRVLPILYDEDIPFFSAFTGASFLRDNKNTNFINFRSSYEQEIETLINYLSVQKKLDKIAVDAAVERAASERAASERAASRLNSRAGPVRARPCSRYDGARRGLARCHGRTTR